MNKQHLQKIELCKNQFLTKQVRTIFQKKSPSIDCSSYDLLNLLENESIIKRSVNYTIAWGYGSYHSRPIDLLTQKQRNCETTLSQLLGKEESLIYPYTPNFIEQTIKLIQNGYTKIVKSPRWQHKVRNGSPILSLRDLEVTRDSLILIDSHEMLENGISLREIAKRSSEIGATLIVDDRLSIGMLGKSGMGLSAEIEGIDLIIGSFAKAHNFHTGYLSGNKTIIEYISKEIPKKILPPTLLGLVESTLEIMPLMSEERNQIMRKATLLRDILKMDNMESHLIIPKIYTSTESREMRLHLSNKGILTPNNQDRVFLIIGSHIKDLEIKKIATSIMEWNR